MHIFEQATPVWMEGAENEKNCTIGLYAAAVLTRAAELRIATSGVYRVFVNGAFYTHGPVRCAHGHYRVDSIPLPTTDKIVHIAIEVTNYAVNSFCYLQDRGFIQAEIVVNGQVTAATGRDGFAYFRLNSRVQKVQRYSYQRPFVDAWRLCPAYADWRTGKVCPTAVPAEMMMTEERQLVRRGLPLYTFTDAYASHRVATGKLMDGVIPASYRKDRSLCRLYDPNSGSLEGFCEEELEWHLSDRVQEWQNIIYTPTGDAVTDITLTDGEWTLLALEGEKTGFITAQLRCETDTSLWLLFDEVLTEDGDVDPLRMDCCNILRLELEAGQYAFISTEPYGFRYIKPVCMQGQVTITRLGVKELVCPQPITAHYTGTDPVLRRIYDAAVETFKQNSADLFMDCPTRERAGWLCDSYFSARTEQRLTGGNAVERNFLENYLLPERFPHLPEGMLPMCYPADHSDGNFIPNWAMWFVLELEDRLHRVGDREFIHQFRPRVYRLLDWFKQYENSDELLEKLPGWVFVEWSKANDFVQDINFPSNMLYARMLEAVDTLYNDPALTAKAQRIKQIIRDRSYNGEFFTDNEIYGEDGLPHPTGECTETCQYYAFFTGVATPQTHEVLWERLVTDFGPERGADPYPHIHPANAFIGNYLRLMLLAQEGYRTQLLQEIKGYFGYMADRTGTLWEHIGPTASCNHGFASYVACLLLDA